MSTHPITAASLELLVDLPQDQWMPIYNRMHELFQYRSMQVNYSKQSAASAWMCTGARLGGPRIYGKGLDAKPGGHPYADTSVDFWDHDDQCLHDETPAWVEKFVEENWPS